MGEINWGLAQGPNAFENAFARSYKAGAEIGDALKQGQVINAFASYVGSQPQDGIVATPEQQQQSDAAWQKLVKLNPALALKLQADRRERDFGAAAAKYYGGNALASLHPVQPSPGNALAASPAGPALLPVGRDASFEQAFAPLGAQQPTITGAQPQAPRQSAPQEADLSFLGQPQSPRDESFLKMLRIDPVRALKIQSSMRDSFLDRLDGEHKFYSTAVDELSRMTDDNGWQRALQRLKPYADQLGIDLGESVPLNYPGPEGVNDLLHKALPVKERLDFLVREANTAADNARADRNTDSMISSRNARLGEQRRYNEQRIATTQRGQDMTDERVRAGAGRRGGGQSGRGSSNLPTVSSPAEADKLPKGTRFRTPDGRVLIAR